MSILQKQIVPGLALVEFLRSDVTTTSVACVTLLLFVKFNNYPAPFHNLLFFY